jgi:hypothetical protein
MVDEILQLRLAGDVIERIGGPIEKPDCALAGRLAHFLARDQPEAANQENH